MAFTNSPENATYKTVNIKFDGTPMFRYGDASVYRDTQVVNLYYDRISQENKQREVRLKKRPGLSTSAYSLSKAASTDSLRGSFYDPDTNVFYWAVNNKIYYVAPDVSATTGTACTLNTSSGYVGFCAYLKSDGTRFIIASDGTDLWTINASTNVGTEVTDVDLPSPHQPYPIYIDGYVFLIKSNTGDIYNSDVDDPTSWASDSFITAEISSDYGIRLFKVKNYIIAMGNNSIEYFYDAGNAPPGSPLNRNDSPFRGVGYVTGGCQIGDTVYFVGQDQAQNIAVYTVNSFKVDKISNPAVDRTLQVYLSTDNAKSNVNTAQDGYSISVDGHTFYVLVTPQTTWVYDVDDKFWYEWKSSDGTGIKVEAVWAMFRGGMYVGIKNQTVISKLSQNVYQDFGANFTCRYVTEDNNFDTFNWKVCHRVSLMCSMHNYTGTSNATISWSDNDWADGGTTGRNINVFSSSPYITRCGKFRNRSFRVEYADNYPFFMTGLQLDINVMGI